MVETLYLDAYCFKCKTKRELREPQAVFLGNGTPATRGTCPECRATLTRMGKTAAHEGLTAPVVVREKAAKPAAQPKRAAEPTAMPSASGSEGEAYCTKCRSKRPIQNPLATFSSNGTAMTRGTCPVCGTALTRFGATPAHATLEKPAVQRARVAKATTPKASRNGHVAAKAKPSTNGQHSKEKADTKQVLKGRLVIVESPTKAKTVGRFLGSGYTVRASLGHVRDLLRSQLSVDVEHEFEPKYRVPNEKRDVIKEITSLARNARQIYLATDPDREGEAIAWHLQEAAGLDPARVQRVVFHEITEGAIAEAFAHPRAVDMSLVNAQQARRILDRLVGYMISPLLWERVRSRTSAGRVQSVALRLIVERERAIQAFQPVEYWTLEALLAQTATDKKKSDKPQPFTARLLKIRGEDVKLDSQVQTDAVVQALQGAEYRVESVKRGERKRNPAAPFTTSTLQQEASRRLGFTAKRTMATAQALYEGIDLGSKEGNVGLITYMRTDSPTVSTVAQEEARKYVTERHGADYLPPQAPVYKTRAKGAQEAHEAIRPTSVWRTPDSLRERLSKDQQRLYDLIWKRFVASQMAPALFDTLSVDILAAQDYLFRVTGATVRFKGFLTVYEEAREDDAAPDDETGRLLPPLAAGEIVALLRLLPEQHFTQPPPRFTEATLVKALEEDGIGRPSTYAPILSTIEGRGYAEVKERRLTPTELGEGVTDLLVKHFPNVFEVGFTARMEDELDQIAEGDRDWVGVLKAFYEPFSQMVQTAEATMENLGLADQPTGDLCEKCGSPMVLKFGRYGKFIACSNYPECRNTKPFLEKIGVTCPLCGGDLVERKSKRGRVFYGCANYPTCNFSSWQRPLATPCPHCGGLLVVQNKQTAKCSACAEQVPLSEVGGQEPASSEESANALANFPSYELEMAG